MIKVLVSWEREEETEKALKIYSKIHELLDSLHLHSGTSTTMTRQKLSGYTLRRKAHERHSLS